MAKSRKRKPSSQLTKKQVSHRRRENKQLRWIWIGAGATVGLIVLILIAGLVSQSMRVVATVNGQVIRLPEYQKRVRFQYHYYVEHLGLDPAMFSQLKPEQRTEFYKSIVNELIDEKLVLQEAKKHGLTVSDDEIQTELEETWFQHHRVPLTPTPSPTPDPDAKPAEETTPQPTATPDTVEAFEDNYKAFRKNVLRASGVNDAYFRKMIEADLLKKKLENVLVPTVPTEEEQVQLRYTSAKNSDEAMTKIANLKAGVEDQVHARHILVATQEEAENAIKQLQAGQDFAALAAEMSTDESNKDSGGDLGWFGRGKMVAPFEEAAFNAEIGLYPFPVQTEFGYHVIEVLEHTEREIDLDEVMFDLGWNGRKELADRFGPLFAEIVFNAEIGIHPDPIPTEYGVAIVEILGHEVKVLDQSDQDRRRTQLFQEKLTEIRDNADIQDRWEIDMAPQQM